MNFTRSVTSSMPVALFAGVLLLSAVGCDTLGRDQTPIQMLLEPFTPPSPGEAARGVFNVYDPDVRARSLALLAAAPFGGEEQYVRTYRIMLGAVDGDSNRTGSPDPDPMVRAAAVKALGQHGTVEDVRLIVPLLNPAVESSPFVRWQAAEALQKIHNPDLAIEPLIAAMRHDTNADVRMAAAAALGQYPAGGVFDELVAALDDNDFAVAHAAARSLRTLTGQDLGTDPNRWANWRRGNAERLFDGGTEYTFTPYQRPPGFLDRAQFWREREPVQPRRPTGTDAAAAEADPKL